MPFQLPFVPAHKFAAALEVIETLKQERDDQTCKAAEARRDATTLAAQRDKLADEVERLKDALKRREAEGESWARHSSAQRDRFARKVDAVIAALQEDA
jgi:uncharacterized coiled-coil DUF342 family protein